MEKISQHIMRADELLLKEGGFGRGPMRHKRSRATNRPRASKKSTITVHVHQNDSNNVACEMELEALVPVNSYGTVCEVLQVLFADETDVLVEEVRLLHGEYGDKGNIVKAGDLVTIYPYPPFLSKHRRLLLRYLNAKNRLLFLRYLNGVDLTPDNIPFMDDIMHDNEGVKFRSICQIFHGIGEHKVRVVCPGGSNMWVADMPLKTIRESVEDIPIREIPGMQHHVPSLYDLAKDTTRQTLPQNERRQIFQDTLLPSELELREFPSEQELREDFTIS